MKRFFVWLFKKIRLLFSHSRHCDQKNIPNEKNIDFSSLRDEFQKNQDFPDDYFAHANELDATLESQLGLEVARALFIRDNPNSFPIKKDVSLEGDMKKA